MTEYDYSPAAYERFIAQQNRVSNWVADTTRQAHKYSNPFVLSPTLRDRSFYDKPDGDDDPPPTIAVPRSSRQTATRSTTLPPQQQHDQRSSDSSSRPSRSRSKSYSEHHRHIDHEREPRLRHRSQSHTRSTSAQRSVQVIYPQPPPHTSRRHSHSHSHAVPPQPFRVQTAPGHVVYQYPSGYGNRPVYYTPPPPGQIYQVPDGRPPHNMSKEHIHPHPSPTRHNSKGQAQSYLLVQGGGPKAEYRRGPPIHSPIPTKPQSQPLLKRLLGFMTMSPVGGRSGRRSSY